MTPPNPKEAEVVAMAHFTQEQIAAAARALADRSAKSCNVDLNDNWNTYSSEFTDDALVALAAVAQAAPQAAQQDDELTFNATRLRNVARLVRLEKAVPEDDATLDGVRGSVLGLIAGALRNAAAKQAPLPDVAMPEGDSFKPVYWFSILVKCARLLNLPDDEPIPSGVLRAVEKLAAQPAEGAEGSAQVAGEVHNERAVQAFKVAFHAANANGDSYDVAVQAGLDAAVVRAAPAQLDDEFRAVIVEAAQVLESAAAHNRQKNRTVLANTQQERADRLRLGLARIDGTTQGAQGDSRHE